MTADPNKGITSIAYNHLNLPTTITFTGGNTITFLYDAGGNKLRKTVSGTVNYVQDYVSGIEYKGGVLEAIYHAEGRITMINSVLKYEYALKDHLGNTRLMFSDKNNDGLIQQSTAQETSEVTQENHYTPFGFSMEGTWSNTPSVTDSKYQYNGKELNDDFGLGLMDYGARMYDAAIGRWNGVDAMADAYRALTPYNYTMNNPMRFIDPNGMYSASASDSRNTSVLSEDGGIVGGATQNSSQQATVHVIATKTADKTVVNDAIIELNKYIEKAEINAVAVLVPDADSFDPSKISPRDAVAVVGGNKAETIQYIRDKLRSITSNTFIGSQLDMYPQKTVAENPEKTDGWGEGGWSYVIATTTQNQSGKDISVGGGDYVTKRLCVKNMAEAVGLSIFHGMGHLSGLSHNTPIKLIGGGGYTLGEGYMDSEAGAYYRRNNNATVLDTINYTKENYPRMMDIIYQRFQKK